MKGKHKVIVSNRSLYYEFEIKRNITIIKGDSATGKTALINMITQYQRLGNSSGIRLNCDVPCVVITSDYWKEAIERSSNSILFLDEENKFVNSEEFASVVKRSDNYFVIITRNNLFNLPYSVDEIYGIRSSGKYQNTKKVYNEMFRIYEEEIESPINPKHLVVEDSNAGYEFFKYISNVVGIRCESAGGKSNIPKIIKTIDEEVCIIADGAAFGPEMERIVSLKLDHKNIHIYLPESFECEI
ncbi:hypothetical protein P261_00485 [Lachnospiraceae bacterium TWA4]|nr:hypothetical protein P261_00485 [Lachnospiraceae bacterium TWA4]